MRPPSPWRAEQESRPCRMCGSEPGRTCVTPSGDVRRKPHAERWNDAMAAKGEPFTRRPEGRTGRRNFDGSLTHGTQYAYKAGCRCDPCKAYARASYKEHRSRHPEITAAKTEHSRQWRAANPEKNTAISARSQRKIKGLNAELAGAAIDRGRHWQRWTGPELEMAARRDLTAAQVAALIGRSLRSVTCMRQRLSDGNPRDRMLAWGPVPPTSRSGPR